MPRVMPSEVELIPGTALPVINPSQSLQPEGRGTVQHLKQGQVGPELFEKAAKELTPHEAAVLGAALRAYDSAPKKERPQFSTVAGRTDGTTGNLVLPLFDVSQGMYAGVSGVTVDVPGSTTINPSAPFANASAWAFLATGGKIGGSTVAQSLNAAADSLRAGMIAFAPTSAAGPFLPGQWTFGSNDEPIAWGGETLYYVIHGGSIAALLGQSIQATFRLNLYTV